MPNVSRRGAAMPASPIRKLVPFAEQAVRRGIHVHHLNIGQPDVATPREFLAAYREHRIEVLGYGHSAGLWSYREALTRYYAGHDIPVRKEEILVTTGGSEAILFALLSVTDPGDEVLIPEPFYTNYAGFAVECGVRILPLTCRAADGFRIPPAREIEARITPRTRAILINNPNNPTGYVLSAEEIEGLAALARRHDLFLLSDEVYREFVYDGRSIRSVLQVPGIEDRAVVIDSVSKRYSACGARIGCLVSRNREILQTALKMGQARLCPPTVDQWAAEAAVSTPPAYFEGVIREYTRRRDLLYEALRGMEGVVCERAQGAFYMIAKLPIDDGERYCRWLLEEFSLEGATVMLAPAAGFYATEGLGGDEVRIAYVLCLEDLERAMKILAASLEAYPGRH